MTLLVDTSSKLTVLIIAVRGRLFAAVLTCPFAAVRLVFSVLVGLVYRCILLRVVLLIVVICLVGKVTRLVTGHWGQGSGVVWHVDGLLHGSPGGRRRHHAVNGVPWWGHQVRW